MPNTGALFVATPAIDDPFNDLSEEDVAHVTMTYFGEAADLPDDMVDELHEVLARVAQTVGPFSADVAGTAVIGPDKASVVLVESFELVDLRNAMLAESVVQEAQALAERQFPWWLPHLTVSYTGKEFEPPESIQIDAVGFWIAGEKESVPLKKMPVLDLTAALSIPVINCSADLPLGFRYGEAVPDSRWYVAKRARALGASVPVGWGV